MQVKMELVDSTSSLYFHTPTALAKDLYLYPLCVGEYRYLPGYFLERDNYPGYSIMFVRSGECHVTSEARQGDAIKGNLVLVSGYQPHSFQTEQGMEACWIHFDGVLAERFYHAILERKGNVIHPALTSSCEKLITVIYEMYEKRQRINEAVISKYLTDVLTGLLTEEVFEPETEKRIRENIRYMNRYFHKELTIENLASNACLSPCYYIRLFKKVTGSSPHKYLLNLRITHAKYYLKTTEKSVKEIAGICGFTTESSFCNAFHKLIGSSPGQYRTSEP